MNSLLDDFPDPKRVLPIICIVETSGGSKNERILIAEGGCMGKISVLGCLLAKI